MGEPSDVHYEWARRLLGQDRGADAPPPAVAIGLAYDRLVLRAGPFIGNEGVRAIFARSLKLAASRHPSLTEALRVNGFANDPAKTLRESLRGPDAAATAAAVLATFLFLLGSFIGARLTQQIIEPPWEPSEETSK